MRSVSVEEDMVDMEQMRSVSVEEDLVDMEPSDEKCECGGGSG